MAQDMAHSGSQDLAQVAKERGIRYFMISYTDLFGGQRATLLVTFATLVATLVLYVVAPKGFLPLQVSDATDRGGLAHFILLRHRAGDWA